jgi:hypothetical protein
VLQLRGWRYDQMSARNSKIRGGLVIDYLCVCISCDLTWA